MIEVSKTIVSSAFNRVEQPLLQQRYYGYFLLNFNYVETKIINSNKKIYFISFIFEKKNKY